MDIKSLKSLTLEESIKNLSSYYKICIENNIKLPYSIGNLIFNFCCKTNKIFDENEIEFFNGEITWLTKFKLNKFNINFCLLNKIYKKNIKEINIINLGEFYINELKMLKKFLNDCKFIEIITLNYCEIYPNVMKEILNSLNHTKGILIEFHLIKNILNIDDFIHCQEFLKECKNIEKFTFDSNFTKSVSNSQIIPFRNDESAKLYNISKGLYNSSNTLKEISLLDHPLHETHCEDIGRFFKCCNNLEKVTIKFREETNGISYIINGLINSVNSLNTLVFHQHNFLGNDCEIFGNFLKSCGKLQNIDLYGSKNINNGFHHICMGLISSKNSIRSLNFTLCYLHEENFLYMAELLKNLPDLEGFSISSNFEIIQYCSNICQGLYTSKNKLQHIDLSFCDLNKENCIDLGNLLENCTNLHKLYLGNNDKTDNGIEYIFYKLNYSSKYLQTLCLQYCKLNDNQCKILCELLMNCKQLAEINFRNNNNIGKSFETLCDYFKLHLNTLRYVNLEYCGLELLQKLLLTKLFYHKKTLVKL